MLSNLEAAIVQNPLVAKVESTLLSAVEQMNTLNNHGVDRDNASSNCVVVVSDELKVLGILTQKDLMRLVTQQQPIAQLTLRQFWQQQSPSDSLIISESKLKDLHNINDAIAYFESSQITHLAIVDAQDQLIGVLQHESLIRLRDSIIHQATASLLVSQQKIHERLAKAEALKDVLVDLLQTMETYLRGSSCSITLCRDGRLGEVIAPSLPPDYARIVSEMGLPIAEGVGSCGTAAFRRELVVVTDIENDPLWQNDKAFVLCYGLQACSSVPIFASDRTLLGVFGIYYREQKAPQAQELDWLAQAANIAGIAIEQYQAVQALQQLNQDLENRVQVRTQELQEREQFLQTVLDTFPLSVFWKDVNSVYLGCNQNFLNDAGLQTIAQIIGKTDHEMPWGEAEADFYRADDRAVIESQTAKLGIEETLHHANGQIIWLETNKLPLRNLQGEVIGVLGTYQDISDRKAVELALQASEAKFRWITESVPGMIGRYVLHPDGSDEMVYVSPQVQQIFEVTPEAVLQDMSCLWERVHPEDIPIVQSAMQESAVSLQPFFVEERLLLSGNRMKWIHSISQPTRQENGDITWDGVVMDISDRKAVELALQASEAKFRRITESVPGMIFRYVLHPDGRDTCGYISPQVQQIFELTPEAVLQDMSCLWARIHKEDVPKIQGAIQDSAVFLQPYFVEGRLLLPNERVKWILVSSQPERQENGDIIWDGVVIDISDRKAAEKALMLKQNHLAALLNNIPHIAWIKDEQSRFIAVNQSFVQACGVSAEELVGKTDFDIWPADLAQAYRNDDAEVLQSSQRKVVVERVARADGTWGWLETTKTPFRDDQLNIAGTVGIAADITDLKTLELSLKASERRYASLAAAAPVAIFRFDTPLHCVYVNERWSQMCGRTAESALGFGWMDGLHPDDRPSNTSQWAEAFNQANPENPIVISGESRNLRLDGSTTWSYVQVAQEFDDDGNVVGYIGTLTDITDRKNIEFALQESQAQFRRMTESVPGMIARYILHPDGRDECSYVSPQVQQIFELTLEDALQDPNRLWARFHPEDLPIVQRAVQDSAASLQPFFIEARLLLPNDRLKWIQLSAQPDRLENGAVILDGVVIDISDRKNAELTLQDLSERLEFALKGANIGIWEYQISDGRLIWDERMLSLYGIPSEEFSGKYEDWLQRLHPDDLDWVQQAERQAYQGARDCRAEFRIIRPDGTIRFIESYAFNQYNAQGEILKTIGLNIDITDRKQAEAQLQRINEELIKATRLKDEFLANMSHELRTPLNAILGMTEILQEEIFGDLNDRQMQSLHTIEKSSNHLLELINDILDVAKVEAGQIKL
ncbi:MULTISPECIES: PAS domain-containing protein [Pseudanabaena]|uniref:PAS domain-containing protein n=1 Tax=Pseudanabaena TaxID=1152 RepID=UPI00247A7B12|nr:MULTISPECIES: PAS domain-containing protein [Pseudanabaena]MEA5489571.1 PAS domain-containing protein [Pseudanabaena sp. CCNP1317]WGS71226.1 PAS domain-containing protein [Pseudanabaena galeata CCNP1313]